MKSGLTRKLSAAYLVLLVVALSLYLYRYSSGFLFLGEVDYRFALWASLVALMFRVGNFGIWLAMLHDLGGGPARAGDLFYAHAKSWMGRYIPGKLPAVAGRIFFTSQCPIPKQLLAVAALTEPMLQVVSTSLLGLLLLYGSGHGTELPVFARYLLAGLTVLLSLLCLPTVFSALLSRVSRLLKREVDLSRCRFSTVRLLKYLTFMALASLVSGISYFLLICGVKPLALSDLPYLVAAVTLSGALGMVAFIAPSGIGVREAVLAVMLAGVLGRELAVQVVIVCRVWSVLIDVLYYLLAYSTAILHGRAATTSD